MAGVIEHPLLWTVCRGTRVRGHGIFAPIVNDGPRGKLYRQASVLPIENAERAGVSVAVLQKGAPESSAHPAISLFSADQPISVGMVAAENRPPLSVAEDLTLLIEDEMKMKSETPQR